MGQIYDFAVIGAGAAGLSAAQYGARQPKYNCNRRISPGGQALFIDKLENYPGILEPINGFELAERMPSRRSNSAALLSKQAHYR